MEKIERAFANPIKFDYDHCVREYAERIGKKAAKAEQGRYFSEAMVVDMPGIDFEKIRVYRMRKAEGKVRSLKASMEMWQEGFGEGPKEGFKRQKQRYKSICNLK